MDNHDDCHNQRGDVRNAVRTLVDECVGHIDGPTVALGDDSSGSRKTVLRSDQSTDG